MRKVDLLSSCYSSSAHQFSFTTMFKIESIALNHPLQRDMPSVPIPFRLHWLLRQACRAKQGPLRAADSPRERK